STFPSHTPPPFPLPIDVRSGNNLRPGPKRSAAECPDCRLLPLAGANCRTLPINLHERTKKRAMPPARELLDWSTSPPNHRKTHSRNGIRTMERDQIDGSKK